MGVRDDIPGLMQTMDVFIFPSIYEGLPLVLVEAQAAGIPTIASKGNIPENVKMTDNFYFLELANGSEIWAEKALGIVDKNKQSDINIRKIRECGYDIKIEARKLQEFMEGV